MRLLRHAGAFAGALWLAAVIAPQCLAAEDAPAPVATADTAPALNQGPLKPLRVLGDTRFRHAGAITRIAPLADGAHIITTARDATARLWRLPSGEEVRRFEHAPNTDVWNAQLLPGDQELLTCGDDKFITHWDLTTGQMLRRHNLRTTVLRMALLDAGRQVIAGGSNNLAVQLRLKDGAETLRFTGHTSSVYGVSASRDGASIVTCGGDDTIHVWDPTTGAARRIIKDHKDDVPTVEHSPDGGAFVTCSGDKSVRLWSKAGAARWVATLPDEATVAAWSPDAQRIAVTCDDHHVYVLAAKDGASLLKIEVPGGVPWAVAYSADGGELLVGGSNMVHRFDARTGEAIQPAAGEATLLGSIAALALMDDGSLVLGGDDETHLRIWAADTGLETQRWPIDSTPVGLDASGEVVLAATGDEEVQLRHAVGGQVIRTLRHDASVGQAALAMRGRRVVTADHANGVYLWNAQTGQLISKLAAHSRDVNTVIVSHDGAVFVSVSDDHTARIWSADDGDEIGVLTADGLRIDSAALSPDGHTILLAGGDDKIHCWTAEVRPRDKPLTPDALARFVAQLGDDDFETREAATLELIRSADAALPHLDKADTDDPEVKWRIAKVRQGIARGSLPSKPLGQPLVLRPGLTIQSLAFAPTGRHFAATVGYGATAEVVLGEVTDQGPRILAVAADGRGPRLLLFAPDGKSLYTGNRDGTVSVYGIE